MSCCDTKIGKNNGSNSGKSNKSDDNAEKQYKCDTQQCGQVFASSQSLIRHKKYKCGKTKPFKCPKCSKSFRLRITMKNHQCPDEIDL